MCAQVKHYFNAIKTKKFQQWDKDIKKKRNVVTSYVIKFGRGFS